MRRRTLVRHAVVWFLSGPSAWAVDRPEPFLRLRHTSTLDVLSSRFERWGRLDPVQARRLERFMRGWREGRSMSVDSMLLRFLVCIRHFAVREGHGVRYSFIPVSRDRPTTCCAAGLAAARNSLHLKAKAADISIAGLSPSRIAAAARRTGMGGVGRYRGFVHVDTGLPRHWSG